MSKKKLFKLFILFHFLTTTIYLVADFFNWKLANEAVALYMNPLFEQHWSMFSPDPPSSDRAFLARYIIGNDTTLWHNFSNKAVDSNKIELFGIQQRIIKYFHGCQSNLFYYLRKAPGSDQYLESAGYKSMKQYTKIYYKNNFYSTENEIVFVQFVVKETVFSKIGNKDHVIFDSGFQALQE
jgi:hypothetical protein